MAIKDALERQGWLLEETKTGKWIAVNDERAAAYGVFGTKRIGKLIGSKFYVVPERLHAPAVRLIEALGLGLERIRSSSGRGSEYPGFQSDGVPDTTLAEFAERFHAEVERCIQK